MKNFFTLALVLMGFAGAASAATVDDLVPLKHSYVLVCDELGARPGQGVLFGDGHFLDLKSGGTTATNKGKTNLAVVDTLGADKAPLYVTQEIVDKYAEYGEHLNWLRLKNTQDMIAMKPTAGSKIIFFLQGNNKTGKDARYPKLSKKEDLSDPLNAAPTADFTEKTVAGYRMDFTVPNDWGENDVLYVGSYNGDMFVSFIIVEALEAAGTPSLKLGPQAFENGLYYREVICKTVETGGFKTIATYTTDGTTPNEKSPVYTEPIKCYKNQTVKFQAYYDFDNDGKAKADYICEGADNEASVSFSFEAPSIDVEGAIVTITSPYEGAENYILVNGENEEKTNSITLEESATITAYSKIINGDYAEFISNSTSKDVYVLNPIKEKKTIAVTAGDVVLDEEATETSTTGPVYMIENGEISADKMDFFVKNLTLKALTDEQYQVPEGNARYIQMSNTNITFLVADGDSVDVKVICSKNSCKNIDADDAAEDKLVNGCTPDRSCYVNVDGTNYCYLDAEGGVAADLKLHPEANIITFRLSAGTHTFQKYSGTGNILISSIEITPIVADQTGISTVKNEIAKTAIFNLAGQKVNGNFKGIIVKDGKKIFK